MHDGYLLLMLETCICHVYLYCL